MRYQRVTATLSEALDQLGGYATIDQLTARTGYCRSVVQYELSLQVAEGKLQQSKLLPRLYSVPGKPLAPTGEFPGTAIGIVNMVKTYRHLTGHHSLFLDEKSQPAELSNPKLETITRLAELAGYELILRPKRGN